MPVGQGGRVAGEQPADAVQRVVFVSTASELFLLHTSANLVDHGDSQLYDVEGVQYPNGFG